MGTSASGGPYYDPYDSALGMDPHPVFRRLRDEAPLYYNERYDFYALSRYDDVRRGLFDRDTFISGRGVILEFIQNKDIEIPPGSVIFEDPPVHTIHRALLARMFTPKAVSDLEPRIRQFCCDTLDRMVGAGGFDFIADLAMQVPMRVIGMLLGIPFDDQEGVRDRFAGPSDTSQQLFDDFVGGELFSEYIDWRREHPSEDLMTDLMYTEFEDENGFTRRLNRDELLMYLNILAAAGNETTGRLIGWTGKLLSDHPDQRRELVEDSSLIPNAVEEILRYEPPALQACRYVAHDSEHYGETVPEGSAMMLILASGNRDARQYEDPERFDVHRKVSQLLSFGFGAHHCLGAALARLEGRVVLEEVLARFPDWEVESDKAKLVVSPTFRGWESLPVTTP